MGEEGQLCLDLGAPMNTPTCDDSCWFSSETALFFFQCFGCIYKLLYSPVFSIEICWGILLVFVSSFNGCVGG